MESSLDRNYPRLCIPERFRLLHYLFLLTKTCLRVPASNIRSKKSKEEFTLNLLKRWRGSIFSLNNSSKFEERITLWNELVQFSSSQPKQKFTREEINKKRILQMVADGRLSAASASLLSDALSDPTEENLAKLQEKHPAQDVPENIPPPSNSPQAKIDAKLVLQKLRSFPKGSAAGPTELRQATFFMLFKSIILHQHLRLSRILLII